eukprot:scaffold1954_cov146-Alexandrium_tamarense.AAC.3
MALLSTQRHELMILSSAWLVTFGAIQAFAFLQPRRTITRHQPRSVRVVRHRHPSSDGLVCRHRRPLGRLHLAAGNEDDDAHRKRRRVVVIGKIIIDLYGDPSGPSGKVSTSDESSVTVGGGGPQAAFGAAAALAVREYYLHPTIDHASELKSSLAVPPKQPITFLAPIGMKNWTPDKAYALDELLLPVLETPPLLIQSYDHITPTINIWHDENEIVQWMPVNGSFGEEGADGLWRNRPSAQDVLNAMSTGCDTEPELVLHAILESGCNPAGGRMDSLMLLNSTLLEQCAVIGVEPIVFPDDETKKVSQEDNNAVKALIRSVNDALDAVRNANGSAKLLVVTPDRPCYNGAFSTTEIQQLPVLKEVIVRDGANGSFTNNLKIPSATLRTNDKSPINPTGAGNAYSAAFVACRGTGSTVEEAASLATAVGAVVCEYEHLPPWTWEVLDRIADGVFEVSKQLHLGCCRDRYDAKVGVSNK